MVLVEDAPRLGDVDRLLLGQRPRQFDQPVEIGADHAVLGRGLGHPLQPAYFLARLFVDLLRHPRLGDQFVQFGDLACLAFFAFAELALDRRHLLAQQHFALPLVERRLGLPADLLREPQHLDAVREHARDLLHPRGDVDGLQDLLLLVRRDVHIGRHQVGQGGRRLDRLHRRQQFRRRLRQQFHGLGGLRFQIEKARLDLRGQGVRLGNPQHARHEERPSAEEFRDLEALVALADEMMAAVRRGDIAHDIGDRAHAVHVDRCGIVRVGVALHQNADLPLVAQRLLSGGDRPRAANRDRQHLAGKQNGVAHRNDNERIRRHRAHGCGRRARRVVRFARDVCLSHGPPPIFPA